MDKTKNLQGFIVEGIKNFNMEQSDSLDEKTITKIKDSKIPQTPIEAPDMHEEKSFLPMLHGKSTDAIAGMSSKAGVSNPLTGALAIDNKEVKLLINQFNQLMGTLGINTHKLLSVGIAKFTASNNIDGKPLENLNYGVTLSLKEYALQCGYDVEEHPKDTPKKQALEAKRASNALKNVQKKIKKDLQILKNITISWSEKVRGKAGDYIDLSIIGTNAVRKGYIYMTFDPVFSQYLIRLPLTLYSVALLKVDARNSNAYNMGLKMTEHFNLDNNHIVGTAQLLKVGTLLKCIDLPSILKVRSSGKSWDERIKEPFERALDILTQCGLLNNWRYSLSKGVEMTDKEATNFAAYEDWEQTLVHFTLMDAPDHKKQISKQAKSKKKSANTGKQCKF